MASGPAGGLSGLFQGSHAVYGERPTVPGPIDYGQALQNTIQQNLNAIPGLSELAKQSTELYSRMLETAYPGITNIKNLGTQQIQSFLRGEVPKDVRQQLQRLGAERGAEGGTQTNSPYTKALTARDLGLTSISLIQGGLSAAERWVAQARSQTFDFSRMFYGPEDTQRQAENEWQRRWLASQVAASPDPEARGRFDSSMALLGMVLSAYGGGPGYQGTYRSPYQGGAAMQVGQAGAAIGGAGNSYFGEYGPANYGRGSEVDFSPDYGGGGGIDLGPEAGGIY